MVVAGDELHRPRDLGRREARIDQRRQQIAQQHQRAGPVAVVRLVAHVQHLRQDRLDVDRAVRAHRGLQHRAQRLRHPPQAVEHVGGVRAVAQHLAETLVERAVGKRAGGRILEHEHPHRGRDDAGHRPDRPVVVARPEVQRAALVQLLGLLRIVDQSFERGGAEQCSAQWPGRAIPGDGRPGVQEVAVSEAERVARGHHVDEVRLRLDHPAGRGRVRLGAARIAHHERQIAARAVHRRAPVDPRHRCRLRLRRVGEQIDPRGDDARLMAQQVGHARS